MKTSKKQPQGPGIAVVEEVADNIYSIKFILQSLGYRVRSFSAPEAVTQRLVDFAPKLIIIDMMIPEGGGFEVIRRIRRHLADVPLMAITADAMDGEEEDVYKAGGQDVLAKPYNVGELQQKLERWLSADGGGISS